MTRKRLAPRTLIAAGLCALGLAAGAPARSETLADALVSAYKTSNLIEQNRAVLRAADEDVARAVAALRPVLEWILNSSISSARQDQDIATSLALQGRVLIYDFGRSRLNVDIAEESVLATRQALVSVEQDVLLAAVSAFFGVRGTLENVAINENSVRLLSETLRATRDQFEVGEVTRTDVAQAEAALDAARASLAAAQGLHAAAREAYNAAIGHYPATLAAAPAAPVLPRSLDEARAVAQRTHPAIRQAQHQASAADLQVAFAAAERMPVLRGNAGVSLHDDADNNASVGVELRQTIYAGGALSANHRQAIANRDAARSTLLQSSVIVVQNVGRTWADIEAARAQLTATERQIAAATIAYEGVQEEAKLGARTTLDVLDAEQALLDARADRITAEANLQVAIYALLSSMGLLTAEHLQLGVPIYDPEAYYNAVRSAPVTSVQGKSLDRVLKAIGRD